MTLTRKNRKKNNKTKKQYGGSNSKYIDFLNALNRGRILYSIIDIDNDIVDFFNGHINEWQINNKSTFYEIFNIRSNASKREIIINYRAISRKLHTDKIQNSDERIKEIQLNTFSAIREISEILLDDEKRIVYNELLNPAQTIEEERQRNRQKAERKRQNEEQERKQEEEDRLERERVAQKQLNSERLVKEQLEQERLEQERLEQERLERERLERERLERERLERLERERLERERLERERLEQLEQERLERERLEREQNEIMRELEEEIRKQERIKRLDKAEELNKLRLERVRLKKKKLEQDRLKQEKLEQDRLKQEKLKQERLEQERLEQERLEQERLEQERIASIFSNTLKPQTNIITNKKVIEGLNIYDTVNKYPNVFPSQFNFKGGKKTYNKRYRFKKTKKTRK